MLDVVEPTDAILPMPAPVTLEDAVRIAIEFADDVDREGRFPAEAMAALKDAKLLGSMVPVELGGGGATLRDVARHCQRLAHACSSTAMIYAMHQIQVACVLNHALHQPWQRSFAQRIAEDQLLLASITSEVGVGGDMRTSLCSVETENGVAKVRKDATTVSYGAQADVFMVTARAHAQAVGSDQVLFAVMREDATMQARGGWDALGMRGTSTTAFLFEGTGNADQVIATPFSDVSSDTMVPVSHMLWGAVWTGIAAEALTRARACIRSQAQQRPGAMLPGAPRLVHATGMLELMQARLKDLIGAYDQCFSFGSERFVLTPAAAGFPVGLKRATELNTLKTDVSVMCHEVVMEAMRIIGMPGYKNGTQYSVGRQLRDILSAQLMISNDRIAANTGTLLLAQRYDFAEL